MIKPRALRIGDTIGLVAPSSPTSSERVYMAKAYINKMGFHVKLGKSCFETLGYLAGHDDTRAGDLVSMFADREVDGILCLRGGYGVSRILDKIDYNTIKENPKLFIGYSDITALHTVFNQMCDLVTFHGPMAASNMSDEIDQFTIDSFFKTVTSNIPLGELKNPVGDKIGCLVPGETSGEIIGGNLALIAGTLGTPYEIDTKGKLLLIEEVNEEPYKVDRMLTQLALAGKLSDANGIILGDFRDCIPKEYENSLTLIEVFRNTIAPFNKPTIHNLKAGHCSQKLTIPLGVKAKLIAHNGSGSLIIVERAAI